VAGSARRRDRVARQGSTKEAKRRICCGRKTRAPAAVLAFDGDVDLSAPALQHAALATLESGGITRSSRRILERLFGRGIRSREPRVLILLALFQLDLGYDVELSLARDLSVRTPENYGRRSTSPRRG
jgi:hypothetical protein